MLKEGNWVGGQTPVGYQYDPTTKKLKPDDHAPVIQRIFSLYLSGKSSTDIARQFEIEGLVTPSGSKWNKARISVILANPVYKGTVIYGKTKISKTSKKPSGSPRQVKSDDSIIIEDAHEPIIDPETYERVEDIRKSRLQRAPSARIGKQVFTGLIRCGLCGRTHSFQRRKGKELRVTSCQTRHYQEDGSYTTCENKGCRLDNFEKLFYFMLEDYVNQLELYLEQIKGNLKESKETPLDEKKQLEGQVKKIDAQIKKVQKGFIAEIYTEEEAQKEIKQLKTYREDTEKQIEKLNRKSKGEALDEMEESLEKLKSVLIGTSDLEAKQINDLLRKHIDYIEYVRVGNHKAEIEMDIHFKGNSSA